MCFVPLEKQSKKLEAQKQKEIWVNILDKIAEAPHPDDRVEKMIRKYNELKEKENDARKID